MSASNKILIVAGESSSALYAQRLLEHWRTIDFPVSAFGVGSQATEELGMERLGRSEDMAVVGIQEVAGQLSSIYQVYRSLLAKAKKERPQVALLLDYPDFNLRLAKKLHQMGIAVVYYISPQLWAWRPSRIKIIQKYVDEMLVVFPFEVDFYRQHEVPVRFVGHPLLDELGTSEEPLPSDWAGPVRLGLMPGSRRSEMRHHLQVQLEAAQKVVQQMPQVRPSLLLAPGLSRSWAEAEVERLAPNLSIEVLQQSPEQMIRSQDLLLCASGTATLFVGLLEKPFVVMYRMNKLSAFLAKKLIHTVDYFCIVNLILKKEALPEYFQEDASPGKLAEALLAIIRQKERREKVYEDLKNLKTLLGQQGATLKVHESLLKYWEEK